jgi:hypothetical protein
MSRDIGPMPQAELTRPSGRELGPAAALGLYFILTSFSLPRRQ